MFISKSRVIVRVVHKWNNKLQPIKPNIIDDDNLFLFVVCVKPSEWSPGYLENSSGRKIEQQKWVSGASGFRACPYIFWVKHSKFLGTKWSTSCKGGYVLLAQTKCLMGKRCDVARTSILRLEIKAKSIPHYLQTILLKDFLYIWFSINCF